MALLYWANFFENDRVSNHLIHHLPWSDAANLTNGPVAKTLHIIVVVPQGTLKLQIEKF